MCGITGVLAFTEKGKPFLGKISAAEQSLYKRGPDGEGTYVHENIALGHTRLAIIDTSAAAGQPFTDHTGRYTMVFNGEFFNYREHRKLLLDKGIHLRSQSDTEVLLYLYILEGSKCLEKINGFFSFAVYDKVEQSLFLARDRYGIKPLLIYEDADKLIFGSEMKALLAFGIPKELDEISLFIYLQLNYIPSPYAIFKQVRKLEPGTYLQIKNGKSQTKKYYDIPQHGEESISYPDAQKKLVHLLDDAVKKRLIADVALGAFLSGGIDSSIVTALAAKEVKNLNTFSIGFKDEPRFDETYYANLVAKKCQTNHTVFSLTNEDLFNHLHDVLDYTDEPFADASALAVYILSKQTRKHVTVALSGDGADELFAGYNKHQAHYAALQNNNLNHFIKWTNPLWNLLPQSRNSALGNKIRQLDKLGKGLKLPERERYWAWSGITDEKKAAKMLVAFPGSHNRYEYDQRKAFFLKPIDKINGFNGLLHADIQLVLQGDMLHKVDLMSMANSLEVRVPFMDYTVTNFACSLPAAYKIDGKQRKKILRDAFRTHLPEELYSRGKKGFEVPLLNWFRTELKSMITDELLCNDFIEAQNIFLLEPIKQLKTKLFSRNPGDTPSQIWALIVFQYWWKKTMMNHS